MNVLCLNEEKKVDDQLPVDDEYFGRIERLEYLVELLSSDLLHVKEQQLRSQKQVIELQADLVAAESAREEAEMQMGQLQSRDHEMLLGVVTLMEKQQQQQQQQQQSSVQHIRMHSLSRSTTRRNPDVIDVTSYEDSSENESMNEHVFPLDDINMVEEPPDHCMMQLWDDLSNAVQQLSSDLVEQRDVFEIIWTKFQLEHNQRMVIIEENCVNQLDALKDMAIEWDEKLKELNTQIQQVNNDISSNKVTTTTTSMETKNEMKQFSTQLNNLEMSVQRHMDSNRRTSGKQLVMKREHEIQIQKIHSTIQNITQIVQEQAEQMREIQTACRHSENAPTSVATTTTTIVDTSSPIPNPTDNDEENVLHESVDITKNIMNDFGDSYQTLRRSSTSPNVYENNNLHDIAVVLQRCQSF